MRAHHSIRVLMLSLLGVVSGLGYAVIGSTSVSGAPGPGTQIVLTSSTGTMLLVGQQTVLTATIENASGNTVTTGSDSTVTVTFAQTGGTGMISGLGTAQAGAVNPGVATITVTPTAVGDDIVDFQASATLSTGATSSNTLDENFDAFHGIEVLKTCDGTTLIGQPYECQYLVKNNVETAPDTLTISDISDEVFADEGSVTSTNLLPDLTFSFSDGASCNGAQTLCTLPYGSSVTSNPFSFYTVAPADYQLPSHQLTDQVSITWEDLCNGGSGNCSGGNQIAQAPGSTTVETYTPSVSTALSPSSPVAVGTSVSDQASLTGASATAGGSVSYAVYSNNTCTTVVASLGTESVTNGAVGPSTGWTATPAGNYWFQATYSGDASNAGPVSSTCTSEPLTVVTGGAIAITELPVSQTTSSGGTASWTIAVTNTGSVALTDVTVADPDAPNCTDAFAGTLAPGASESQYACSRADVTTSFVNTATATGTPPTGPNVTASAEASVTVDNPGLSITETADASPVSNGTPIGYTTTVSNSSAGGTATATAVTVSDSLPPGPTGSGVDWSISPAYSGAGTCSITGSVGSQTLSCSFGNLAPGASTSVHIESPTDSGSAGTYTNTADAAASNAATIDGSADIVVEPPTISAVTFGGSVGSPTVSISGSGFGTTADLGAPQTPGTCAPTGTGSDYENNLFLADSSQGWAAGQGPGDCVGLLVSSYSNSEIVVALGSGYSSLGYSLTGGDNFTMNVLGATFTGTVSYSAPPIIDQVNPDTGYVTGGETVTILGSGLSGATQVAFGGIPATINAPSGDSSITVTSPGTGSPGAVAVTVTTPAGTSSGGADSFTYTVDQTTPSVKSCTPGCVTNTVNTPLDETSVSVTGASGNSNPDAATNLLVNTATLNCGRSKGGDYDYQTPVATLSTTDFAPGAEPLTVTETVGDEPNTTGVKVCYAAGSSSKAKFLRLCASNGDRAPCLESLTEKSDDVVATFLSPADDPRFWTGDAAIDLTSFAPAKGRPGQTVSIKGRNLTQVTAVLIGGAPAEIDPTASTDTKLVVTVASTAVLGPGIISVTADSGTAVSTKKFNVT